MVRASVRGSGDAGSNPVRNKLVFSKNFCCSEKIITLEYARMCLQVKKIRVAIRSPMAQPAVPSPGSGRTKKTRGFNPRKVQVPFSAIKLICMHGFDSRVIEVSAYAVRSRIGSTGPEGKCAAVVTVTIARRTAFKQS